MGSFNGGAPADGRPPKANGLLGLRGIVSILIFFYHFRPTLEVSMPVWFDYEARWFQVVSNIGHYRVDIFFLVSGFVMMLAYERRPLELTWQSYRGFMSSRCRRVLPTHLAALAFLALIVLLLPGLAERYDAERFSAVNFIGSALLIQNWAFFFPTAWNSPTWSVSALWLAYLVFPLIFTAVIRIRSLALAGAVVTGSLAAYCLILYVRGLDDHSLQGTYGNIRCVTEFVAGAAASRIRVSQQWQRALSGWTPVALIAGLFLFAGIDSTAFAFGLCAVALIVYCANIPGSMVDRGLSIPPLRLLGRYSLAVYFWHWPAIQIANWSLQRYQVPPGVGRILVCLACMALIALCCWASYQLLERGGSRKPGQVGALRLARSR